MNKEGIVSVITLALVTGLPGYLVNRGRNLYNPHLVCVLGWLPIIIVKMYGSYKVTWLPDIIV